MSSIREINIHYSDENGAITLSKNLKPYMTNDLVIVCIGTDKCIGDCLGPLVGTLLEKSNFPYPIYGTLYNPVHAVNLKDKINYISKKHPYSFIIAIDACLSNDESIGTIQLRKGPIYPGKGVGKELPPVGDISIIGIVDILDENTKANLHSIRLGFIMKLSEVIVDSLWRAINEMK
ncbi:spore protease YyaC [Caloranaerobacter sp. TR13]|uniref:spore protease YyaC n=1 Tax=Caloranaerobacter sp. TR13 TaxID=1302151 RepID=UPI000B1A1396|nr:spore protease YyaC [Caloranaerobacter sp. TR13]